MTNLSSTFQPIRNKKLILFFSKKTLKTKKVNARGTIFLNLDCNFTKKHKGMVNVVETDNFFAAPKNLQYFYILDSLLLEVNASLKQSTLGLYFEIPSNTFHFLITKKSILSNLKYLSSPKVARTIPIFEAFGLVKILIKNHCLYLLGAQNTVAPLEILPVFNSAKVFVLNENIDLGSKKVSLWPLLRILNKTYFDSFFRNNFIEPSPNLILMWKIYKNSALFKTTSTEMGILYHIRRIEDKRQLLVKESTKLRLKYYRDRLLELLNDRAPAYRVSSIKKILRKSLANKASHWILLQRKDVRGLRNFRSWDFIFWFNGKYTQK